MNKKILLSSLAGGAALLALALKAASGRTRRPEGPALAEIDAFVAGQLKRLNVPGAVLVIVENDQITHLRGFGRARQGGEVPGPHTPFVLGSLTKSFTALAIMQLVEAGQVELDAPVRRYLPWFRPGDAGACITVRHLLHQTSGLPAAAGWTPLADFDARPGATGRQARELSALRLARPAGAAFEYCNANYNLLGLIVEAAGGQAYAGYVQEHIFEPLKMYHSYTSQAAARQAGLAVGHRFWFWKPCAAPGLPLPSGSLPSGQLISCAEDMGRYLCAQLNQARSGEGRILSAAGVAELQRGAADVAFMGVPAGQYGMGWFVTGAGQDRIVWHAGCVPDFTTYMALLPGRRQAVALLVNAGHFMMNPVMTELGGQVAARLAGQAPAPGKLVFTRWAPWAMRLLPLVSLFQVAAALRWVRRWRRDPQHRPHLPREILLPLLPDLLLASSLAPVLGRLGGFLQLFMPDFVCFARVSGGFAAVWMFLRTGLALKARRGSRPAAGKVTGGLDAS
ncbi:MAG: beta-lactamase family protein [Chloroflexi bacterium]|nr:beta-lactamase family protein [Chloroflexota bacterium]